MCEALIVEVISELYDLCWAITNNLHPTQMPNKAYILPRYGSVTESVAARRLHCTGTKSEPVRCKSCYAFLAGTESVPVTGAGSVTDSS